MNTRQSYVNRFGESEATAIERAAAHHANGINDRDKGSDSFRWAITVCIGYECFTNEEYRNYHGINASADNIKGWIREHGELNKHDRDVDYLCLFVGGYSEYMP